MSIASCCTDTELDAKLFFVADRARDAPNMKLPIPDDLSIQAERDRRVRRSHPAKIDGLQYFERRTRQLRGDPRKDRSDQIRTDHRPLRVRARRKSCVFERKMLRVEPALLRALVLEAVDHPASDQHRHIFLERHPA